jgi:hypothetical protein
MDPSTSPTTTNTVNNSSNPVQASEELLKKTPKRVKGITRKLILRIVNRKIIKRLASRASIGIPLVGLYFVVRVLRNDFEEIAKAQDNVTLQNRFKVLAGIDSVDLCAQVIAVSGMTLSMALHYQDPASAFSIPDVLQYADKVSLTASFSSTVIGTFIEIQRHKDEIHQEEALSSEQGQQQQQQQQQE